jgi:TRAP-type mannitol/chloroaromatic compound transport system permease small subunit
VAFFLLVLQALSELIKRVAFLMNLIPDPAEKDEGPTDEELLAEELRKRQAEGA